MQLYCGIDLHSNNAVVSIIDETDRVIKEKRLNNDLDVIGNYLAPFQSDLRGVVIESTYNWYWLVDGLMDKGYPVHLANTLAIQQYNGIKHTNDETDARFLAHLLRLDILPTGFIYPKEARSVRDVLRRRLLMVKQSTAQFAEHKTVQDYGKQSVMGKSCQVFKPSLIGWPITMMRARGSTNRVDPGIDIRRRN